LRGVVIRFLKDESGATAIEYGLIAALVAVGAIVAMTTVGNNLTGLFWAVDDKAGAAIRTAAGSTN
jgi:pilus assembly protein Flp/PilA